MKFYKLIAATPIKAEIRHQYLCVDSIDENQLTAMINNFRSEVAEHWWDDFHETVFETIDKYTSLIDAMAVEITEDIWRKEQGFEGIILV